MPPRVAIIYNQPDPSRYNALGEEKAILGVLDEVQAVEQALAERGYPAVRVPLVPPLEQVREVLKNLKTDVVFNLFEGFEGSPETEVAVADILSELRLTYTGCPAAALSLSLDKAKTKELLAKAGIATPGYQVLSPQTLSTFHLNYPCIVKPCAEDASHGLSEESVVYDFASLERQVGKVSQSYGGQALVEEFLDGREFNVTVLGNREPVVLPISEIVFSLPPGVPRILTFAAKWEPESPYYEQTQAVCPAEIDAATRQHIVDAALSAFQALGCRGYARVDFRLDAKGLPEVIEVNPNPDISLDSGAVRQAKASGMNYSQFIERIVLLALERRQNLEINIRPTTGTDKPAIMQILRNTPEFKPVDVAVAEELVDCYLNYTDSGYYVLVAEVGSAIAGYICYGPAPLTEGSWDVYWLAVAASEQGRGIGRALLTSAEGQINEALGRLVFIETSSKPEYEKASRLYLSHGYDLICRVADYYEPGDDKLLFQKRLK
ncbi:MAG: GNAT family N-acetyltransferase [Chloroflexi bacterium]|nr:GNAT family N-acetyltransferase [Chloroflexota bacterium]